MTTTTAQETSPLTWYQIGFIFLVEIAILKALTIVMMIHDKLSGGKI